MNDSGQTGGPLSGKRRYPAAIERCKHIRTQGRKAAQTAGLSTGSMAYTAEEGIRAYLARFLVKVIDPIDDVPSTAFFLNDEGFLLTCWHVVEPGFAGTVRDRLWAEYRGERYEAAVVKKLANRNKDVAVLRIAGKELQRLRSKGFDMAPLAFPYHPSDPVAAFGYQRQDKLADPLLIRGYIDRDNTPLSVALVDKNGTFAKQQCLATVFRHAHFDLGMSGAPILDTRTGCVIAMQAGVLPSSHSPRHEPLGFVVPLTDVVGAWKDFADECNVVDYEPLLDDEIVPPRQRSSCATRASLTAPC